MPGPGDDCRGRHAPLTAAPIRGRGGAGGKGPAGTGAPSGKEEGGVWSARHASVPGRPRSSANCSGGPGWMRGIDPPAVLAPLG